MTDPSALRYVPGYEGLYSVTAGGRVFAHEKRNGRGRHGGRWLAQQLNDGGYATVRLFKDGRRKKFTVHSLVAKAWIGDRPTGLDINHIDGSKTHNAAMNLEYCTRSRNVRHAIDTGLKPPRPGRRKLTPEQAAEVRRLAAEGFMNTAIAKQFGLSKVAIGHIVNKRTYVL